MLSKTDLEKKFTVEECLKEGLVRFLVMCLTLMIDSNYDLHLHTNQIQIISWRSVVPIWFHTSTGMTEFLSAFSCAFI